MGKGEGIHIHGYCDIINLYFHVGPKHPEVGYDLHVSDK
jgi:hypothetical protein